VLAAEGAGSTGPQHHAVAGSSSQLGGPHLLPRSNSFMQQSGMDSGYVYNWQRQ
jgi:hypothetical protein